jgi:hypothetical protein
MVRPGGSLRRSRPPRTVTLGVKPPGRHERSERDPHYVDLLPAWLTNESYPQFHRRSDLLLTFVSIDRFTPE